MLKLDYSDSSNYYSAGTRDRGKNTPFRYMLKVKTMHYEVLNQLGSWFSRYPIFKVYTIMYNTTGKFSTKVEITIFRTCFPTRSPYSIEQTVSPPVQWSRGASPPGGGGGGGVFYVNKSWFCTIFSKSKRFNIYVATQLQ